MNKNHNWKQAILEPFNRNEGQSMVLVAVMGISLLGFAGLGVSVATIDVVKSGLQNAVDAAALAGAQVASVGGSASSESTLITHDDSGAKGSVSVDPNNPSHIDATATKVISGGFAALFGFPTFTISAQSVAKYWPGAPFQYAVFQGSTNQNQPLTFNGNDAVQYVGGSSGGSANVYSNGDTTVNGSVTITGSAGAVGTVTVSGGGSVGNIQNNQPILSMPKWKIPSLPDTADWQTVSSLPQNETLSGNYIVDGNITLQGDTINGSIMATDGGSITLNGGNTINGNLYTSGGGNLSITGSDNVNGNIELADNTTQTPSSITIGGGTITGFIVDTGGNVTLSGNASAGGNPGLTLGAFPQNGLGGNITLDGGVDVTGVLYAPSGSITFNGNNDLVGSAAGAYDTLNGDVKVSYSKTVVNSIQFKQVILIQ